MKSSSLQLDYSKGQDQDKNPEAFDFDKSIVFFLFDLTQCKFHYAGGSPNFKGYESAKLGDLECQCLKKILHPEDLNYILDVYQNFQSDCRQPGFDKKTHFKWSAGIRILTESESWSWVEVSFDILSYTDDHSVDKVFCTLKEENSPATITGPLANLPGKIIKKLKYPGSLSNQKKLKINKTPIRKSLGTREIQVLRLIADGNSDKQIAKQLGISIHTYIRHRKNLIEKFKVKNTAELIKDASKVIWL